MSDSVENIFVLPTERMGALTLSTDSRLRTDLILPDSKAPFWLLDCFDGALCRKGQLLIANDNSLDLLTEDGRLISQPLDQPLPAHAVTRNTPLTDWSGALAPMPADLPDGPVVRALDLSRLRRLLPVAGGEMRCGQLTLSDDEGKIRLRARILWLASRSAGDLAVISLQPLRGYGRAADEMRQRILDNDGRVLAGSALYRLLVPESPHLARLAEPVILASASARATATGIIDSLLPAMRANEFGIIADLDSEFLHDYRIALRKIRSVISLFRHVYSEEVTSHLKTEFAGLMAPTGRLRDLDVYLLDRQTFHAMVPDSMHPGLDRLFAMFVNERRDAQRRLSRHLKSQGYARKVARAMEDFSDPERLPSGKNGDRPVDEFACSLIWKRYRKIAGIAAGITGDSPDEDIHQLRIQCKKLRYLIEFFEPLFDPAELGRLLKPMKKLQNSLGRFNDYSVQQTSLQAFMDNLNSRPGSRNAALAGKAPLLPETDLLEIAQSVGALVTVLHGHQLEERDNVMKHLSGLTSPQTRSAFRGLFHRGRERQ